MSFTLNSNITIGQFKQVKPHSVFIKKRLTSYVNTCEIKLPASAVLVCSNTEFNSVQTAKQIKEGEAVKVELGYNGSLKTEFVGFVSRVDFSTPVEVECEGYSYQLRKNQPTNKTFKNADIKEVLKHLINGTEVVLDDDIPSLKLEKLVVSGHTSAEVLDNIKKALGNIVYINMQGKVLYVGLQFLNPQSTVKYQLGFNVIKDNNLKLREAKNDKITIVYRGKKKDGSNVEAVIKSKGQSQTITTTASAGNEGETKTIVTHAVTDKATLQKMAEAKLKQMSYSGYEGKITAFLQPFCQHGWSANLVDKTFAERSGNYIITSIIVKYGMSGARRIVELGEKL